ncbi:MAG: HPF/RaiA family ribosome-associated protein [Armatimonadota bacterium]
MTFLLHDTASRLSRSDRAYAESKLTKLAKFLPGLRRVHFVHTEDKLDHQAELHIQADGVALRVCAKARDIRSAIDRAVERASGKLRKVRGKVLSRNH